MKWTWKYAVSHWWYNAVGRHWWWLRTYRGRKRTQRLAISLGYDPAVVRSQWVKWPPRKFTRADIEWGCREAERVVTDCN